jgi:hypothetical protein
MNIHDFSWSQQKVAVCLTDQMALPNAQTVQLILTPNNLIDSNQLEL